MSFVVFVLALGLWSAAVAYFILFRLPAMFKKSAHGGDTHHGAPARRVPRAGRSYSTHEGFRSFAQGAELTIDDIVKGLTRDR